MFTMHSERNVCVHIFLIGQLLAEILGASTHTSYVQQFIVENILIRYAKVKKWKNIEEKGNCRYVDANNIIAKLLYFTINYLYCILCIIKFITLYYYKLLYILFITYKK